MAPSWEQLDVNWIALLEKLTETAGWDGADGPDSGVGEDYWYMNAKGDTARLNFDQGFATLTFVDAELEADGEEDAVTLWEGTAEDFARDQTVAEFCTNSSIPQP